MRTEALVTNESEGVDDLAAVPTKATTTVAMDFGRITLAEDLVLYLFGTPGQRRFWFMWDDLCLGAIGAIVLVDTDRLDEAFSPLDYFESKGLPFIVAVNQFDNAQRYPLEEVRAALAVPEHVPDDRGGRPRPRVVQARADPDHGVLARAAHGHGGGAGVLDLSELLGMPGHGRAAPGPHGGPLSTPQGPGDKSSVARGAGFDTAACDGPAGPAQLLARSAAATSTSR